MLKLMKANQKDIPLLYGWRNDKKVRALMFSEKEIKLSTHTDFWKKRLKKKDCFSLMVIYNNKKIGIVRLDKQTGSDNSYEVGILIDPNLHGKGLGSKALSATIKFAQEKKFKKLCARIKKENNISKKLFANSGFYEIYSYYEYDIL